MSFRTNASSESEIYNNDILINNIKTNLQSVSRKYKSLIDKRHAIALRAHKKPNRLFHFRKY